jgi:hypothetical protein
LFAGGRVRAEGGSVNRVKGLFFMPHCTGETVRFAA